MISRCVRCGTLTADGVIICSGCALALPALALRNRYDLRIPKLVTNEKPRRDYR